MLREDANSIQTMHWKKFPPFLTCHHPNYTSGMMRLLNRLPVIYCLLNNWVNKNSPVKLNNSDRAEEPPGGHSRGAQYVFLVCPAASHSNGSYDRQVMPLEKLGSNVACHSVTLSPQIDLSISQLARGTN